MKDNKLKISRYIKAIKKFKLLDLIDTIIFRILYYLYNFKSEDVVDLSMVVVISAFVLFIYGDFFELILVTFLCKSFILLLLIRSLVLIMRSLRGSSANAKNRCSFKLIAMGKREVVKSVDTSTVPKKVKKCKVLELKDTKAYECRRKKHMDAYINNLKLMAKR